MMVVLAIAPGHVLSDGQLMQTSCRGTTLRLCLSSGVPASPRLASLLALQRAEEPETPIALHEAASVADVIEGVREGRYDMGMTEAGQPASQLRAELLWQDELAVALPERSPLLSHAAMPVEALLAYPVYECCSQACGRLFGSKLPVSCETTSFELMVVLVAAGYGVGIGPRARIEHSRRLGVVMRPLVEGHHQIRTCMVHSGQGECPAIERFVKRARTVA